MTSTGLDDGAHAHRKLAPHRLSEAGSRREGLPSASQLALPCRIRKLLGQFLQEICRLSSFKEVPTIDQEATTES